MIEDGWSLVIYPEGGRSPDGWGQDFKGGAAYLSARTGAPVARLRPLPPGDRVEVLWWRRGAWGPAGPFGASFDLDDALAFIASEPAFWIRA
jgi:1-acyl-sn-glycerol-3-phosphate acyltransferase